MSETLCSLRLCRHRGSFRPAVGGLYVTPCIIFLAFSVCVNEGGLRLVSVEHRTAKSSKAPCLELSDGKIFMKGSSFLVLSPSLLKACGRSLQTPPAYDNEGRGRRVDAPAKIRTD